MFGVPGAVLAFIQSAKGAKRKVVAGILGSAAVCAFVCGITEPFEFAFMFIAPALYFVYSLLYGIFTYITAVSGFRAGFSFSAGATDLLFSASMPAAQKTWMIIPLGAAAFIVFYLVFRFMIKKFHIPSPGDAETPADVPHEDAPQEDSAPADSGSTIKVVSGVNIPIIIEGLGGKDNIVTLDNCATRLRVELKDASIVDEAVFKPAGAKGVMKAGKNGVQVIIGLKVQSVADAAREYLKQL